MQGVGMVAAYITASSSSSMRGEDAAPPEPAEDARLRLHRPPTGTIVAVSCSSACCMSSCARAEFSSDRLKNASCCSEARLIASLASFCEVTLAVVAAVSVAIDLLVSDTVDLFSVASEATASVTAAIELRRLAMSAAGLALPLPSVGFPSPFSSAAFSMYDWASGSDEKM